MTPVSRHRPASVLAILTLVASCASPSDDEAVGTMSESPLTAVQRMPRYQRIRDSAAARGLRNNAFLLAAIAFHESRLAMCWSEATQHCRGPSSPACGGGPVLAGSGDGPCSARQGGLGMFQFDAGTFEQTVSAYGNGVLTIEGQVSSAIDFVVRIVKLSAYTTNAETDAKSLAWLNAFDLGNRTLRDQWVRTVLRYYNGCPEGGSCWAPRYQQYNAAIDSVLSETNGAAFWRSGASSTCPGYDSSAPGPINEKYRSIGACTSDVGPPIAAEIGAPDGIGRYRVYERGSIYWSPATGAHFVVGRIRDKWKETGWEVGLLGYPMTDELKTPDTIGRFSVFERGSVYWKPETDAHAVYGRIRDAWRDTGWEAGPLGYPIADEEPIAGGRKSTFENGSITWMEATDETQVTTSP